MPKYKVTLVEDTAADANPFRVNPRTPRKSRTWEIDAKNEKEVRTLFDDAKRSRLPHVRGFKLYSIDLIPKP